MRCQVFFANFFGFFEIADFSVGGSEIKNRELISRFELCLNREDAELWAESVLRVGFEGAEVVSVGKGADLHAAGNGKLG
ncbi:MAG: hypothetical protein K2L42_05340 [Clostridia bacterium]|nr:hypothetical protein [Clostridia bacterium]